MWIYQHCFNILVEYSIAQLFFRFPPRSWLSLMLFDSNQVYVTRHIFIEFVIFLQTRAYTVFSAYFMTKTWNYLRTNLDIFNEELTQKKIHTIYIFCCVLLILHQFFKLCFRQSPVLCFEYVMRWDEKFRLDPWMDKSSPRNPTKWFIYFYWN